MKKIFIILIFFSSILFICNCNSFGQTEQKDTVKTNINYNNVRGPDITGFVIALNRIIFIAKISHHNIRNFKFNLCWNIKNIYYLEGMELSEDFFFNLNLRQKNVVDSLTYVSFDYRNKDTLNCIETEYFFITLKIPIILNGIKLKPEEKKDVLSKIRKEDLQTVRTNRNFWGKNKAVEITTH